MLAIAFVIFVIALTVACAYYVRVTGRIEGPFAAYVLLTTASQIMASKIATFDFIVASVTAPAGAITIAATVLMTDLVNERFGRAEVHRMILVTLVTQIALAIFLYVGGALPAAPFWQNQNSWDSLLGLVPRITLASWVTFLVAENLDAWLYSKIRAVTGEKHLWARNSISSLLSLTVDTIVFVTLAFAGTGLPLLSLMIGQWVAKYIFTILAIPGMYLSRAVMNPAAKKG